MVSCRLTLQTEAPSPYSWCEIAKQLDDKIIIKFKIKRNLNTPEKGEPQGENWQKIVTVYPLISN